MASLQPFRIFCQRVNYSAGVLDRNYDVLSFPQSRVESLMTSERIQHQIDRLPDAADEAVAYREWAIGTWAPPYLVFDRMRL